MTTPAPAPPPAPPVKLTVARSAIWAAATVRVAPEIERSIEGPTITACIAALESEVGAIELPRPAARIVGELAACEAVVGPGVTPALVIEGRLAAREGLAR